MKNPYVGPRPFDPGEHLVGRDRETTELYYLLSAERIVLLHSPSGAGKSSLINAGLLPRLRERFDVWQPTRVNLQPPEALASRVNRYVLSAALGFEQGIPKHLRRSPQQLEGMTLLEHASSLPRPKSAKENVLLVFDQFEEILTTDPLAVASKREFFDQLGDLLRDTHYWALFAMREDYLAPLDPYADRVPTHFKNRLRIDLLSREEQAPEAIAVPAARAGRPFDPDAVERLVSDLARMKVQQPDGSFVEQAGLYVEPLQLQVVCRRLWEGMAQDATGICLGDVEKYGNVSEALSGYYAAEVAKICGDDRAMERAVREWVNDRLITPEGIRGQVLRGVERSEGLANTIISKLVDTHLVRSEPRAGAIWYELAHDRLIEPLRSSNLAWRDENLHQVQKRASLWDAQDRPEGLLLLDAELEDARTWAAKERNLTENERAFLEASENAQKELLADRAQARRNRQLTWVSTIGFVLAVIAAVIASVMTVRAGKSRDAATSEEQKATGLARKANWQSWLADGQRMLAHNDAAKAVIEEHIAKDQTSFAQAQKRIALAGKLIGEATVQSSQMPNLLPFGTLLALESMNRHPSVEGDDFLRTSVALLRHPVAPPVPLKGAGSRIVFSHNGRLAAVARSGTFDVIDLSSGQKVNSFGSSIGIRNSLFSPDDQAIATWNLDGSARVWDVRTGKQLGETIQTKVKNGFSLMAFSPDGQYLAGAGGSTADVWKVNGSRDPVFETQAVVGPFFTADGKSMVTALRGTMTVWSVGTWMQVKTVSYDLSAGEMSARYVMVGSPDGKMLAFGRTIYSLADWKPSHLPFPVGLNSSFSPDSRFLASLSGGAVSVVSSPHWDNLAEIHTDQPLTAAVFSPQPGYLATASQDGTARLWRLSGSALDSTGRPLILLPTIPVSIKPREVGRMSHPSDVYGLAFSGGGDQLATSTRDQAQLWSVSGNEEGITTYRPEGASPLPTAISADGASVARAVPGSVQIQRITSASSHAPPKVITIDAGHQIRAFDISDDGRYVATAVFAPVAAKKNGPPPAEPKEAAVAIWNVDSGKKIAELSSKAESTAFLFSPEGKYLVTEHTIPRKSGQEDAPGFDVRDIRSGKTKLQAKLAPALDLAGNSHLYAFSASGRYFAAIGAEGNVHLWETENWSERMLLPDNEAAKGLVFSAKADVLAASSRTKLGGAETSQDIIRVWHAPLWTAPVQVRRTVTLGLTRNTTIALSPTGDLLATADWTRNQFLRESNVLLWREGQLSGQIRIDREATGLAFSHDGKHLSIVSPGSIKVWDQLKNQQEASVDMETGTFLAVFGPDGKYLLTLDDSGGAVLWFWGSERVASVLCQTLSVNLSPEEWHEYLPGEDYRKTCANLPVGYMYSQGLDYVRDHVDESVTAPAARPTPTSRRMR